ncbi:MAG: HPr family phosphocarrier protein [Lachnospiraceae bacterium]
MISFNYTITDPVGMHARPAGLLAKEVKKYESTVTLSKDGKTCDAQKLMMVMSLGIKCGDTVTVEITGPDEQRAGTELEAFFKVNF